MSELSDELAANYGHARAPEEERDPKVGRRVAAGLTRLVNLPSYYTYPGAIGDVFGYDTKLPGHDTAEKMSRGIDDGINYLYDIDDPQTPLEWAAEMSTALLPARWMSAAGQIAKVAPQAAKTIKAARVADALLVPGVQGKYSAGKAALNFGIPYTAVQGLSEYAAPESDTIFNSMTDGKAAIDPDADGGSSDELAEELAKFELADDAASEREDNIGLKLAAGALVVLGGRNLAARRKASAIAKLEKRAAGPSLFEPREDETIASTGALAKGNIFDEMEPLASVIAKNVGKENAELFRAQARLSNQVGIASKHEAALTTGHYPISESVPDIAPIRSQPLQDLLYATDQLDNGGQRAINESLTIMDELDHLRVQHGNTLNDTTPSGFTGRTKRQLEVTLSNHMKDGRVSSLVKSLQQQPRVFLDYLQQSGLYTAKEVRDMKGTYPNFVPHDNYEVPSMKEVLLGKGKERVDAIDEGLSQFTRPRNVDDARGVDFSMNFLPPAQRLVEMQRRVIKTVEVNNTRKTFFDAIVDSSGNSRIKGIYKVPYERMKRMNADDVVKFRRAGVEEYWRVKDPTLLNLLKDTGQGVNLSPFFSAMNTLRQVKQFSTTGPIANPAFQAVSGQVWEPLWAIANTPKGMKTPTPFVGMIGMVKGMKAVHAQRLSEFYRQEFLLRETGIERASSPLGKLWANLFTDVKNLSDKQVETLAHSYSDAYAKSAVHMYRMLGGGGTQAFQDFAFGGGNKLNVADVPMVKKLKEAFGTALNTDKSPDLYGNNSASYRGTFSHYARGMLDAVHNGTRYRMFENNLPKAVKDGAPIDNYIDDLAKLAFKTRDLMDMSAHGYGKAVSGLNATIPYHNAMLQGFYRTGKQYKERPLRSALVFGAVSSAAALQTWLISRDPEFRDWYWNELTPEKRAGIVIPVSDDPRESLIIPLDPVLATQWNIGQNVFDASFGISTGQIDANLSRSIDNYFRIENDKGNTKFDNRLHDMGASAHRLAGFAVPPAAHATAGLAGKRFRDTQLTDFTGQDVQEFNSLTDVPTKYVDGIMNNMVETIMGGLTSPMVSGFFMDFVEGVSMKLGEKPGSVWEAIGYGTDNAMTTYGGRMAGADAVVSSYNIDARDLKKYGESFKRMEAKWNDARRGDRTRVQNGVRLVGATPLGYDDPMQEQMFEYIKPRYDGIKKMFEGEAHGLKDLMKQRQSVQSDPRRSADQKRTDINNINTMIQTLQGDYMRGIEILEDDAAKQFGLEEFDIRTWEGSNFKSPPAFDEVM